MRRIEVRGATVRERWTRWPNWSVYAALVWSLAYGCLALFWAFGGGGFPFGANDPEAGSMGSILISAEPRPTGLVIAGCCLVGVVVALVMRRPTEDPILRRTVIVLGWTLAVVMIFFVPDVRLLQNFAYALMFIFVKVDWTVLNQALVVLGGVFLAAATLAYQRRTRDACGNCGRDEDAAEQVPKVVRWGRVATYTAFLMPVPYGITRLAWALGIPLGIDQDPSAVPVGMRIGEAVLAFLAIGGGVLTIGLIRPWGEIWPRWVPFLAGKRVPVGLPTVIGGVVATVVMVGAFSFVRINVMGELGMLPVSEESPTITGWAAGAPGWLWPAWALALGVATAAYYYRRRAACRVCGVG